MSTIVTRAGKGTPLTNNEVDANFTNLNNDKLEVEVNDLTTSVTWDNVPDAYITASSVTQHETALTITESQISDLQNYLTSYTETNDLSTAVTWDNVPDEYITQSSVTQHESALTITESQISNLQSYLTSETSHADVLVDGDFASAGFMKTNGNGGYSVDATTYLSNEIKDEDDMSSNSSTALATQQSIKAYVDAHTSPEVNDLTSSVTWANVPDANITQSSVTQHQSALSITESQISDLGTYLTNEVKDEDDMASDSATALATQQSIKAYVDSQVSSGGGAEVNDLSTTVTWANVPDAYITQSSVTQHQAALSITESQISDLQSYLTTHQDISGKANLSGATFTGIVQVGQLGSGVAFNAYGSANLYSGANVIGDISVTGTVDGVDIASLGNTVAGKADLAGDTFTGTITAPNIIISTPGSSTTSISTGTGASGHTKIVNIGDGYINGGITTINLGASSGTAISKVKVYGDLEVTGDATGVSKVSQTQWYDTLTNIGSGVTTLTTTYKDIGPGVYAPATETAAKTRVDFQMTLAYGQAYSPTSNDGYYRMQVEAPNPSNEDTQFFGTASVGTSINGAHQFTLNGDLTQYITPFSSFATNAAGTTGTFGTVMGYFYTPSTNKTTIRVSLYQANKPSQTLVYHHPFGWESAGTLLNTPFKYIDAPYGTPHYKVTSGVEHIGKFKSSVSVQIQAREVSNTGTISDNISVDDISGIITKTED